MPTPLTPNIIDRILDSGPPRGRERAYLAAARPPVIVKVGFALVQIALGVAFLTLVIIEIAAIVTHGFSSAFGEREGFPDGWWFVAIGLGLPLARFVEREVLRQYGMRALKQDQGGE